MTRDPDFDPDRDRAVTPVVGKGLEAAIVLLYVASLVAALHGGVLPDYRTATATEVGDRTLASAADRVETSVPPPATAVDVTRAVSLPETIGRSTYRIHAVDRALVLDHPDPGLGGRIRLSLPDRVVTVEGSWESDDPARVSVQGEADRIRVILS
ncbi:DUF7266 family protein [Haloplanus sp.]|uniref:DUF7266 family protein n=1 Tax=Haloplanus sp. TaxID=1961696 RepID=UPI00260FD79F|nr:hypothetical protein [Haloplanus sp.]